MNEDQCITFLVRCVTIMKGSETRLQRAAVFQALQDAATECWQSGEFALAECINSTYKSLWKRHGL